jgi:2,3-bisphosphoglycerate-dependent phosphoglycerate mutase
MHIKIHKAGQVNEEHLKFVVICVKFKSQWLLVRHKERTTWEMPGGHIDDGESSQAAALNDVLKNNLGSNIVIGSHGTALSTIINYYNSDFGYEGFWSIADKMPYILCFKFNKMEFIGMEEVEL